MLDVMVINAYSNLKVWRLGYYVGENAVALNVEYFKVPAILYPFIRFDAWLKGSKCRRCDMEVLQGMGMVV